MGTKSAGSSLRLSTAALLRCLSKEVIKGCGQVVAGVMLAVAILLWYLFLPLVGLLLLAIYMIAWPFPEAVRTSSTL
jgi:hypothetical protein